MYVPQELTHGYRSLLNKWHDSTLVFECELVGIAAANTELFRRMMNNFDSAPRVRSFLLGILMPEFCGYIGRGVTRTYQVLDFFPLPRRRR